MSAVANEKMFLKSVRQLLQAFILVAFPFVAHCIHLQKRDILISGSGFMFCACVCMRATSYIENDRLIEIRIVPRFYRAKDGAKIARDK